MTTTIVMPQLAETVVEGTITRWLKKEGERVRYNEPLVEIMTDKATVEMPSPTDGVLTRIIAQEGTTLAVGAEMALIEGEASAVAPAPGAGPQQTVTAPTASQAPAEVRRYSPIVLKLAQEHGVDLSQVKGTGAGGRVTRQDVEEFLAKRRGPATGAEEETVPVSPMRRIIAERLTRSSQTVPHAWAVYEADVTGLVQLRTRLKDGFRSQHGVPLTYLPFFVKAVTQALPGHPLLNATWAGDKIILKKRIHISIAVATEDGLTVPVLRDADHKSITTLARELHALIEKAHARKLSLDDLQGGTFTVNNAGSFGTVNSIPIINEPQAAILNIDAIRRQVTVLENDAIAVRSMVSATLAFDHRILDGAGAGRFMLDLKRNLEAFGPHTPIT